VGGRHARCRVPCAIHEGCLPALAGWRGVLLRLIMGRKLNTGPIDSLSRLKLAAEQLYERSRG
jgi:hypothetical protein